MSVSMAVAIVIFIHKGEDIMLQGRAVIKDDDGGLMFAIYSSSGPRPDDGCPGILRAPARRLGQDFA